MNPVHTHFAELTSLLKKSLFDRSVSQSTTRAGSRIPFRGSEDDMKEFFNTLTYSTHSGE
jgi:hypothetical protein